MRYDDIEVGGEYAVSYGYRAVVVARDPARETRVYDCTSFRGRRSVGKRVCAVHVYTDEAAAAIRARLAAGEDVAADAGDNDWVVPGQVKSAWTAVQSRLDREAEAAAEADRRIAEIRARCGADSDYQVEWKRVPGYGSQRGHDSTLTVEVDTGVLTRLLDEVEDLRRRAG